jgi:hypothetical protein
LRLSVCVTEGGRRGGFFHRIGNTDNAVTTIAIEAESVGSFDNQVKKTAPPSYQPNPEKKARQGGGPKLRPPREHRSTAFKTSDAACPGDDLVYFNPKAFATLMRP